MKNHKKTLFGSILAFLVGTSCCWFTSIVIWIGGASILGTVSTFIKNTEVVLIILGLLLFLVSVLLYLKERKKQ